MKKVLALVLILTLCAIGLSATAFAEGDTFKLGCYFGLTGGNSMYGIECRNGVQLAVDYVNENGGLNGQQIELIVYDTQCSVEEAAKVAQKLITQDQVDACIGSMNSGEVVAAAPFFNRAGIYHIGCGTANSWMQEDWPFVFRACMNNDFAVPVASALLKDLNYESVAIFYGQEEASKGTAEAFQAEFEKLGIDVVDMESYSVGDTDYSAQIAKMLSADPDIICISVIGEIGGPLVKQLRLGGTLDYSSGNREGYNTFPSFILVDGKNVQFSEWMANGGYEPYLEATGNDK